MRALLSLATFGLAAVLFGCGGDGERPSGPQPSALVATTGMISEVLSVIAGDDLPVIGLIAAGVDPHLYKPTRSDLSTVLSARAFFHHGLKLEGRWTEALAGVSARGTPILAVGEAIALDGLLKDPESGQIDPHLWMDPYLWQGIADPISELLERLDPEHRDDYKARAEAWKQEVSSLQAYAVRVLSSIPKEQRVLVTAHDAFRYFGQRFDFEVHGLQGISTESEAGLREVEALVDLLVQRKIRAVFVESTIPERSVQALIAGAAARGHRVALGGELFSDAMGEAGTYRGTYIGMIDHNVTTIARALGGEAPATGAFGRLLP